MGKYRVRMKVTSVTLNKKKKGLTVTGRIGDESPRATSKVDIVDHEAVWTESNFIVKGTLSWKQSEDVLITLFSDKLKTIASFTIDLIPFVNETCPGGHKEFSFKRNLSLKKGKSVIISLFLSITREGDHETEKEITLKSTESRKSRTVKSEKTEQDVKLKKLSSSSLSVRSSIAKGKLKLIDDQTSPRSKKPSNAISPRKADGDWDEAPPLGTPNDSPTKVISKPSPRGKAINLSLVDDPSGHVDEEDLKSPIVRPMRARTPRPGSDLPKKRSGGDRTPTKSTPNSEEGSENSTGSPKSHRKNLKSQGNVAKTPRDRTPEKSPSEQLMVEKKFTQSQSANRRIPLAHRLMDNPDINMNSVLRSKNSVGTSIGGGMLSSGGNGAGNGSSFIYSIEEVQKPPTGRLIEGDRIFKKKELKASAVGSPREFSDTLITPHNHLENKTKKHTRPHSDMSGAKDNINIALLKQEYLASKYEAAEKYLVEDIIMEQTPRELHVVAAIIWKSLIEWESFVLNHNIYQRILTACERAVEKFAKSRTMSSNWLSTFLSLLYMSEEEKKKVHCANQTDVETRLQDFIDHLQTLASTTFENVFKLLNERLGTVTKTVLSEFLSPSAINIAQDDQPSLTQYFVNLSDWLNVLNLHCIFNGVKKQFFSRVIHYIAASVMDILFSQATSYGMGIQVKMLVNKIEEWVRGKVELEFLPLASTQLVPLRQAANILCLLQKSELTKVDFRQEVCDLLNPAHIALILEGYLPDQYDKEPVPKWLIDKIAESPYTPLPNSFEPNKFKELDFSFEMTPLDFSKIILPKVILEKPAFSFLKPSADSKLNTPSW